MPPFKKQKAQKGEVVAYQHGKCLAMQWQDKVVTFLSSIHAATMEEVANRKDEVNLKPTIVLDYNNTMGGVDKCDQNLSYYPCTRNRQNVYYKKIFQHLMEMAIFNAYVLYAKSGGKGTHLDFRVKLVEELLLNIHDEQKTPKRGNSSRSNLVRHQGRHFHRKIPPHREESKPHVKVRSVLPVWQQR